MSDSADIFPLLTASIFRTSTSTLPSLPSLTPPAERNSEKRSTVEKADPTDSTDFYDSNRGDSMLARKSIGLSVIHRLPFPSVDSRVRNLARVRALAFPLTHFPFFTLFVNLEQ